MIYASLVFADSRTGISYRDFIRDGLAKKEKNSASCINNY